MSKAKRHQNPIAVAMTKRHATTTTRMKDRRLKRPKDARRAREWSEG
jgi:hypothetical protein